MRQLHEHEIPLVAFLFELAEVPVDIAGLVVMPMNDGGMGSLSIAPFDASRRFGSEAAECHFRDADGTIVSATLNLDRDGAPFEIDVWRVDSAPTVTWASPSGLTAGPPN